MAEKQWRHWTWGGCNSCGGDVEVLTNCKTEEICEDDEVRCSECGCTGIMQFDEGEHGGPWVLWRDDPRRR